MIPSLTIEPVNILKAPIRSYDIPVQYSVLVYNIDDMESIFFSTEKFNKEQQNVFNKILGEILPGVKADNPEAPIENHYSL